MAKGDICKIPNCLKKPSENRNICPAHRGRWKKFKSYDLPIKPAFREGIIKFCNIHGELTLSQCLPRKLRHLCKACSHERYRRWRRKNPNTLRENYLKIRCCKQYIRKMRDVWLKRKFGITIIEYESMLEKQNGKCAICKNYEVAKKINNDKVREMSVDHCHKTGKVRGLLCTGCNTAIGHFKESIESMQSAIEYLRPHLEA